MRKVGKSMFGFADDQALIDAGMTPDMEVPGAVPEAPVEEVTETVIKGPDEYRMGLETLMANEAIAKEDKAKVEKAMASLDEIKKMLDDVSKVAEELMAKYPPVAAGEAAPAGEAMA